MDVLTGPAVVLDRDDCTLLARQLVEAIRSGYTARGRPPPERLLDLANQVSTVARGAAGETTSGQLGPRPGTVPCWDAGLAPSWGQPAEGLMIPEAAALAGVCESLVRLWCRRGDVQASRGPRGAWKVDIASLAAVIAVRRRKEHERKAA